jgi:type IV pilus assembly protein PilB
MSIELGKMLVKAGKINEEQLNKALELQKSTNGKLGEILVRIGAIEDENIVSEFVGKQLNIGALRLTDVELNPDIVKLIPQDIARRFNVIAVSKIGKTLIVAIADPNNIYVLDAIKFITGCTVQPVISPESIIQKALDIYYEDKSALDSIIKEIDDELEV